MKRILIRIGAAALVVGGFVAILWPVPNWRMYDANWQPLAMTEAEAYCAGLVSAEGGRVTNEQRKEAAKECWAETSYDNTDPNISVASRRFCQGIAQKVPFDVNECVSQVESYGVWPLLHGGYTWEWNTSNKRPEVVHSDIVNAPRGSGRTDGSRNDQGRGFGE